MSLLITYRQMKNVVSSSGAQLVVKMPTSIFLAASMHGDFQDTPVETLDVYNEIAKNEGIVFCPNLIIDVELSKVIHHDGRHRAVALQNANIDTIQVLLTLQGLSKDREDFVYTDVPSIIQSQYNVSEVSTRDFEYLTKNADETEQFMSVFRSESAAKQNPETYDWYKLKQGRPVQLKSQRGRPRSLDLGQSYGIKELRGSKIVVLFEDELSNLYPITPQLRASLIKRSSKSRRKERQPNRGESNTNLVQWDAEFPRVKGRLSAELKTGVKSQNLQWRKATAELPIKRKNGKTIETIPKNAVFGCRVINEREGVVIANTEGLREVITFKEFKAFNSKSKIIPINRWPTTTMSRDLLVEYRTERDAYKESEHKAKVKAAREEQRAKRRAAAERKKAQKEHSDKVSAEKQERVKKARQLREELKTQPSKKDSLDLAAEVGARDTASALKAQIDFEDDDSVEPENWVDATSFEPTISLHDDLAESDFSSEIDLDDMFTDLSKVKPLAETEDDDDEDEEEQESKKKPKKKKSKKKNKSDEVDEDTSDDAAEPDEEVDADEPEEDEDEGELDLDESLEESMDELKAIDDQLDTLDNAKEKEASTPLPDEGAVVEINGNSYCVLSVKETGRLLTIDLYSMDDELDEYFRVKLKPSVREKFLSELTVKDSVSAAELDTYKLLAEDMEVSKDPLP